MEEGAVATRVSVLVAAALALGLAAGACAQGGAEGPPRLKRGIPKKDGSGTTSTGRPEMTPSTGPAPEVYKEIVTDSNGRVVTGQAAGDAGRPAGDPVIEKAREVVEQWVDSLPNFLCQQITYRYQSETKPADFRMKDRVTAELAHEGTKDEFRNVEINGKKLKKGTPEESGSWSVGEFGAMAADVLSPATSAKFEKRGSETVGGRMAKWYDYTVEKENSHWRVTFEGQTIYPAYKGSIWIDEETHRVLRLEMVGRQIPAEFAMDKVEMMVEYGKVKIGPREHLMPVKSGSLACKRGTLLCMSNQAEYRNYRQFATESTIMTTESTVTFEGVDEGKAGEAKQDAGKKGKKR